MRKTLVFEVTYNHFEPGTRVKPASRRCVLDPGVYVVTKMCPPLYAGDEAVCFVEGHEYGVTTEYLAETQEDGDRS